MSEKLYKFKILKLVGIDKAELSVQLEDFHQLGRSAGENGKIPGNVQVRIFRTWTSVKAVMGKRILEASTHLNSNELQYKKL